VRQVKEINALEVVVCKACAVWEGGEGTLMSFEGLGLAAKAREADGNRQKLLLASAAWALALGVWTVHVVISTQGKGDEAALRSILSIDAAYKSFVGSKKKMASIRDKLITEGATAEQLDAVKAPAGLDIGAIAPEEIALSILSEITAIRRKAQRPA
jgi:xanthine/CO dehydrogenase XdhC/CoxF family maturation factor